MFEVQQEWGNKYFELKNSWGCHFNSEYLFPLIAALSLTVYNHDIVSTLLLSCVSGGGVKACKAGSQN